MDLYLRKIAKALRMNLKLSYKDIIKVNDLRLYRGHFAEDEVYLQKILTKISKLVKKVDSINKSKIDNEILANWCKDFMDKIEEIAKEKYPNVTYWCDTGSDYNVIMAMLEQFRKDL